MNGGNQIEFESPFRTFEAVANMFGKSAKMVGRWVQTIPGFPHPAWVGCSRLFLSDEIEDLVQRLKEKRDRNKNRP